MRKKMFAAAALIAAATLTLSACGSGDDSSSPVSVVSEDSGANKAATVLDQPFEKPDLVLTDTKGQKYDLRAATKGRPTLIYFGYTHCPDICNVVLANMAAALRGTTPAVRKQVRLVFVNTDPRRDTATVVRDYLDRFDPRIAGLVAPVGTVATAAKDLYLSYEKPDGTTGGAYEVDPGPDPPAFVDGRAKLVWSDTTTVADLRADLAAESTDATGLDVLITNAGVGLVTVRRLTAAGPDLHLAVHSLCLFFTSPSPRDSCASRMPSSA